MSVYLLFQFLLIDCFKCDTLELQEDKSNIYKSWLIKWPIFVKQMFNFDWIGGGGGLGETLYLIIININFLKKKKIRNMWIH